MQTLIVLLFVGLAAQLIDGALGMAYGATSTTLLLTAGIAPATASASVHLAEMGTTLASGAAHWRFGNVHWRTVSRAGVSGAIGAFAGAVVLSSVSTAAARPWTAGVLLTIGVYILARFTLGRPPRPKGRPYVRGRHLVPLGLFAGVVDATGGGGWGPITTPTLLLTGKMHPRTVIGSVDTSEFMVASAASAGFLVSLGRQGLTLSVVAALLAGGLVAAPLAAWLVSRVQPRLLGACVGGMLAITNVRTLFGVFGVESSTRTATYAVLFALWAVAIAAAAVRREAATARALPVAEPAR